MNSNSYVFLKWTNNTKQEKSIRKKNIENMKSKEEIVDLALTEQYQNQTIERNERNIDKNDLVTDLDRIIPEGFIKQNTKRDGQNEKLLSRGMMIQKSINPFLDTTNYIKHLDAEDEFLRPKDSNF